MPCPSSLLAQKQLVAVEVLELHPRSPRPRLRLAEELHAEGLHPLVLAAAVRRVEAEEGVAPPLLPHERAVRGLRGQLERERDLLLIRPGDRDPAPPAERFVL